MKTLRRFSDAAAQQHSLRILICCFDPLLDSFASQVIARVQANSSESVELFGFGSPALEGHGLLPIIDAKTWREMSTAEHISRLPVFSQKQKGVQSTTVPSMYTYIQSLTKAVTTCFTQPQPDGVVVLGSRFFSTQFWGAFKTALSSHKLQPPARIQVGCTPLSRWPVTGGPKNWRDLYPVDCFISDFPSEADVLNHNGIPSVFCGCPWTAADQQQAAEDALRHAQTAREQLTAGQSDAPVLFISAGNDDKELEYSLPFYDAVARHIQSRHGAIQLVLSVPAMYSQDVMDAVANFGVPVKVVSDAQLHPVAAACDVSIVNNPKGLVASALVGTPSVAVYRQNAFTHLTSKLWPGQSLALAPCNHGLPHVLVPEVAVWGSAAVSTVADPVLRLLQDQEARQQQVQGLRDWLATLNLPSGQQASEAVALRILQTVQQHKMNIQLHSSQ